MIYYFSGTGNSYQVAKLLAYLTQDKMQDISTVKDYKHDDSVMGFVFPVHGWRPPKIVREFIKKMTIQSNNLQSHYCYALCTAGDDIGMTMEYLNKDLAEKGLCTHSTYSLKMPDNFLYVFHLRCTGVVCYDKGYSV